MSDFYAVWFRPPWVWRAGDEETDPNFDWSSFEKEMADAQAVIDHERAHEGALLWWVALVDRATTPSGIMSVSVHDDPLPRLRKIWHGLWKQRDQRPDTWRIVVAPVHLEGTDAELGILVTLPRDRPMVVMERDPDMPAMHEEYLLSPAERAVLVKLVPRDLAHPRPYLRGLRDAGKVRPKPER
jgi:hypothetical protein